MKKAKRFSLCQIIVHLLFNLFFKNVEKGLLNTNTLELFKINYFLVYFNSRDFFQNLNHTKKKKTIQFLIKLIN